MYNQERHSLPTAQELELLQKLDTRKQPSGVDRGFKYRNAYVLIVGSFFILKLLFFPENTGSLLSTPMTTIEIAVFAQYRALFALGILMVYATSYLKDWYFPRVALMIATSTLTVLVMDFFNVYAYMSGGLTPSLLLRIFLRIGIVYCLFTNSIRDNRAPVMPRSIFS